MLDREVVAHYTPKGLRIATFVIKYVIAIIIPRSVERREEKKETDSI